MTPLQQAAQALIDRWLSPSYIAQDVEQLRKALESELAQSVEPVPDDAIIKEIERSIVDHCTGGDLWMSASLGKDRIKHLLTAPTNWTRPINYTPPHMGRKPLTGEQLNTLWHDTINSGDPTAGNAHIRFYHAATKQGSI